jgi:hypothetical protein
MPKLHPQWFNIDCEPILLDSKFLLKNPTTNKYKLFLCKQPNLGLLNVNSKLLATHNI